MSLWELGVFFSSFFCRWSRCPIARITFFFLHRLGLFVFTERNLFRPDDMACHSDIMHVEHGSHKSLIKLFHAITLDISIRKPALSTLNSPITGHTLFYHKYLQGDVKARSQFSPDYNISGPAVVR